MWRVGSSLDVYVTALEPLGNRVVFFAQTDFNAWGQLETMLAESAQEFEQIQKFSRIDQVHTGDILVAKYEDDAWYRGQVLSTNETENSVTVNFIDFGNTEVVKLSDVVKAPNKFFQLPPQAQKFMLADIQAGNGDHWTKDEVSFLTEKFVNGEYQGKVTEEGSAGTPLTVQLYEQNVDKPLSLSCIDAKIGQKIESHVFPLKLPSLNLEEGDIYEVFVTFIRSTMNFWIHLASCDEQLQEMHQPLIDTLKKETNIYPGQMCISEYGGEDAYYRAVITKIDTKKQEASVTFLDYGNSENVSLSKIMVLHPRFCELPAQAITCCLTGDAVFQPNFESLTEREDLKVKILKVLNSGVHIVEFVEGAPTSKAAKSSPSNQKATVNHNGEQLGPSTDNNNSFPLLEIDMSTMHDLCISHVAKNGTFYCQFLANAPKLDAIMCDLQKMRLMKIDDVSPGMPCIVQSSVDELSYRGRILKETRVQCIILLVDFGDMEAIAKSNVFHLSNGLSKLPEQAFACRLTNCSDTEAKQILNKYECSKGLVGKFLSKSSEGYEVELYDTSSSKDVKLSDLVKSVNPDATKMSSAPSSTKPQVPVKPVADGSVEKMYITAVLSKDTFFGQLASFNADNLDKFQRDLSDHYLSTKVSILSNPRVGDICCTAFSEDGLFYRARIMEVLGQEAKVSFLDYGNSEKKPTSELKELVDKFCGLPEQGITCTVSSDFDVPTKADLEGALLDQEVEVKIIQKVGPTYTVIVHADMLQRFKKQAKAPVMPVSSASSAPTSKPEFQKPTIKTGLWDEVLVSHIDDPEHFFLQLVSSQDALNSLSEQVEVYASGCSATVDRPTDGGVVIAKDSNGGWYRGSITGLKRSGEVEVHFVDYGNCEEVSVSSLRPPRPDLLKTATQAVHCRLAGVVCTEDGVWPPAEIDQLWAAVDVSKLVVNVRGYDEIEECHEVELFAGNKSLNESFGRTINKLSPDFVSGGPVPSQLPATGGAPPQKESANSGWAKGFEESNKKKPQEDGFERKSESDRGFGAGSGQFGKKSGFDREGSSSSFSDRPGSSDSFRSGASRDNDRGFGARSKENDSGRFGSQRSSNDSGFGSRNNDRGGSGSRGRDGGFGDSQGGAGRRGQEDNWRDKSRDFGGRGDNWRDQPSSRSGFDGRSSTADKRTSFTRADSWNKEPVPLMTTPKLKLTENEFMDVYVSYATSPGQFWCQLKKNSEDLESMMEELGTEYAALGPNDLVSTHLSKAQLCCAKYSADEGWYRATVSDINGDKITVLFVDYGNKEIVIHSDVKLLKEIYLKLPFQAFQCSLSGVEPIGGTWSSGAIDKFSELTIEKSLVACIVEKKVDSYTVELIDHSNQIHEALVKANLAKNVAADVDVSSRRSLRRLSSTSTSSKASTSSKSSCVEREIKDQVLSKTRHVDVNVSYVHTPQEFWIQLTENTTKLQELMDGIAGKYDSLGPDDLALGVPEVGQFCCGKFLEDDAWYRAVVSEVSPGKAKVRFVDYGNDEWLPFDRLKELDNSFISEKAQAVKCILHGAKPKSGQWSTEASIKFEEITVEKNLVCKVMSRSDKSYVVKLVDVDGNKETAIANQLIQFGMAEREGEEEQVFKDPPVEIGKSYRALPSWVTSSQNFYCQLENNQMQLVQMTEELFEHYQKLKLNDFAVQDPHIGQACVSCYDQDGNWYRSKILKLRTNEALVLYVDYGNKAKVTISKVKKLTKDFADIPLQAIQCCLSGLQYPDDKWNQEAMSTFQRSMTNIMSCKFVHKENDLFTVELTDDNNVSVADNINSICSGKGPIRKSNPPKAAMTTSDDSWGNDDAPSAKPQKPAMTLAPAHKPVSSAAPEVTLPSRTIPATTLKVYIVAVISPTHFYLQLADEADDLQEFAEVVHSEMEAATGTMTNVKVGTICGCRFSEDECWYRARVEQVQGDSATVRFVDYGNTDTAKIPDLKQLTSALTSEVPFCLEGSLSLVKAPSGGWPADQIKEFEEKVGVGEKELDATFSQGTEGKLQVKLVEEDTNLSLEYMSHAAAVTEHYPDISIPSDTTSRVFISHVDSPAEFYVHLVDRSDDLDNLMATMAEFQNKGQPSDCSPGTACAAIFADDGSWYRAKIVAENSSKYDVFYVDYGNSDTVEATAISELGSELTAVAPFAIKCSLDGIMEPASGWDSKLADKLVELGGESEKELLVNFVTSKPPCRVQLMDGEFDLNQQIKDMMSPEPEVENVATTQISNEVPKEEVQEEFFTVDKLPLGKSQMYVSHVESPAEIYVQLAKHSVDIEQLVDIVDTKYGCVGDAEYKMANVSKGQLCCAKMTSNNVWYRAKILSAEGNEYTVRFVDYGNTDVVPVESIKKLTDDLKKIPQKSCSCCLTRANAGTAYSDEIIDKLFDMTTDKILTVDVQTDTEPCSIVIYDKDICVNDDILGKQLDTATPEDEIPKEQSVEPTSEIEEQATTEVELPVQSTEVEILEYDAVIGKSLVYVSAVESPMEFYVQRDGSEDPLNDLATKMLSHYEEHSANLGLDSPSVGQICCTHYTADGSWCRTRVADIRDEGVSVFFMDYGNSDIVEKTDLFQLAPEFAVQPRYAGRCSLAGLSATISWTEDETASFLERVQEAALTINVLEKKSDELVVELYDGEVDVAKEMFQDKIESQIAPEEEVTAEPSVEQEEESASVEQVEESASVEQEEESAPVAEDVEEEPAIETQEPTEVAQTPSAEQEEEEVAQNEIQEPTPENIPMNAGDKFEVYVTEIVSPSRFWCQRASSEDTLAQLFEDLKAHYDGREADGDIPVGQMCAVCYTDGEWYRARVTRSSTTETEVLLVDYGTTYCLPPDLHKLDDKFTSLPYQCVECVLADVQAKLGAPWPEESVDRFRELVEDKKLTLEVTMVPEDLSADQNTLVVVRLRDMGISVATVLLDAGLCEGSDRASYPTSPATTQPEPVAVSTPVTAQPKAAMAYKNLMGTSRQLNFMFAETPRASPQPAVSPECVSLLVGSRMEAYVSHVESVDEFYIQLHTAQKKIEQLSAECQKHYEDNEGDVTSLQQGAVVMGRAADGHWYRASIRETQDADNVTLHFLDYGNTEVVPRDAVRSVLSAHRMLPFQAVMCRLYGVAPVSGHWYDEAINAFAELTADKRLLCEIKEEKGDIYHVKLFDMGRCLTDALVTQGHAVSTVTPDTESESDSSVEQPKDEPATSQDDDKPDTDEQETDKAEEKPTNNIKTLKSPALSVGDYEVFVSHADTPGQFWCQLAETSDQDLPLLQDRIQDDCRSHPESVLEEVSEGQTCLAVYDGVWYRAQVSAMAVPGRVQVCFVDYGNSEEVASATVRPVPDDLMVLPKQAFPCVLAGVQPLSGETWDEASQTRFQELVMYEEAKGFRLSVESIDKDGESIVCVHGRLTDDDRDIAESLICGGYARRTGDDGNHGDDPEVGEEVSRMVAMVIRQAREEVEAGLNGADTLTTLDIPEEEEQQDQENFENSFLEVSLLKSNSVGNLAEDKAIEICDTHAFPQLRYPADSEVEMILISAIDPDNVVMRPAETSQQLQQLLDKLQDTNQACPPPLLTAPQTGQPCCVRCHTFPLWQRGVITSDPEPCDDSDSEDDEDAPARRVEVYYVDRGEPSTVPGDRLALLTTCPDALDLPAQAVRCRLAGVRKPGRAWQKDAGDYIESLCRGDDRIIKVKVAAVTDDHKMTASLEVNECDVASALISEGYAHELESLDTSTEVAKSLEQDRLESTESRTEPGTLLPVRTLEQGSHHNTFLSHVASPGQVWCQVNTDGLGHNMEILNDYYNSHEFDKKESWTEGDLCCALVENEELWYRAQVQSVYGDIGSVRFLDYGYEDTLKVADLRPLLAMFCEEPRFAVECRLHGIKPMDGDWSEDSTEKLREEAGRPLRLEVVEAPTRGDEADLPVVCLTERNGGSLADGLVAHRLARRDSISEDKS